ncbi:MAG: carboxypeptidase regulatory-like domain-containing protein [Kiritimatiellia bacterium]
MCMMQDMLLFLRSQPGLLMALFIAWAVSGCGHRGPKMGVVKGKVTLDGQPAANLVVNFSPVEGGINSSGVTAEDGTYVLVSHLGKGAAVGRHRVAITSQRPAATLGQEGDEDDPNYMAAQAYASLRAPAFVEKIPARYNTNSELIREVKAGENIFDFDLTTNP